MIAYPLFSLQKAFYSCPVLHRIFPQWFFFIPSSNIFNICRIENMPLFYITIEPRCRRTDTQRLLTEFACEFWCWWCWSVKTLPQVWWCFSARGHWSGFCVEKLEFLKSSFQNRLQWNWSLSSGRWIINMWLVSNVLWYQWFQPFQPFSLAWN